MLAALLLLGVNGARAQSFTVDTTSDTVDASPGDGSCADAAGDCSLRAALMEGEASSLSPAVAFTISLPTGTFSLTLGGSGGTEEGDLDIENREYHIIGAGPVLGGNPSIIEAPEEDRVFQIGGGSYAGLHLDKVLVKDGDIDDVGGCIFNEGGSLILELSMLYNCHATGAGGGVYSRGEVYLITSLVVSNSSESSGGGLWMHDSLFASYSTISNNTSGALGGGVYIASDIIDIQNTYLNNNTAETGGALFGKYSSWLSIEDSQVVSNTATLGTGGGVYLNVGGASLIAQTTIAQNTAYTDGGGIDILVETDDEGDSMHVVNTTFYQNEAGTSGTGDGGGIHGARLQPGEPGSYQILAENCTFLENEAATDGGGIAGDVDTAFSAFSTNTVGTAYNDCDADVYPWSGFLGNNVWYTATSGSACDTSPTHDTNALQPISGYPTAMQWYALPTPAGAADDNRGLCANLPEDQLGIARPPSSCDIGAVEN